MHLIIISDGFCGHQFTFGLDDTHTHTYIYPSEIYVCMCVLCFNLLAQISFFQFYIVCVLGIKMYHLKQKLHTQWKIKGVFNTRI